MPSVIFIEILGIVAGILTTASFIPQIVKAYRIQSLEDISYLMYIILGLGFSLWLIYGILIKALAVIFANIAGIIFTITILIMKRYYSKK